MKQIHSKDKELSELKRKLSKVGPTHTALSFPVFFVICFLSIVMAIPSHVKFEIASPSRSDSAPELEKKMRSMAMEKLRMEKLIDKLYSVMTQAYSLNCL